MHGTSQTVPNCAELYKNTFKYHTTPTRPADFQECFDFIGKSTRVGGRQAGWQRQARGCCFQYLTTPRFVHADSVQQTDNGKVLIYCMSGL